MKAKQGHTKPVILCVDDDTNILRLMKRFLCANFNVITATTGSEGLTTLQYYQGNRFKISAVISDYKMPGLTGLEFLKQVKSNYPGTACILITSLTKKQIANLGCLDFPCIQKPADMLQLEKLIKQHISQAMHDQNQNN